MPGIEDLTNLLATLAEPAKFKAQLAELRQAIADGAAAKQEREDLEVAKLKAKEEVDAAQAAHDKASAETDKRLAARLVEIEAREKRAADLEAKAAEHEAKARAIHGQAEEKWRKFTA